MATPKVPDALIFKALVHEIQEVEPYWSAIDILQYMFKCVFSVKDQLAG